MRCSHVANLWQVLRHGRDEQWSRLARARRVGVVAGLLVICRRRRSRDARKHAIGLVAFAGLARTFASFFQPDYPYAFDAAWIGVEDFELEKIRSGHDLSARRQATCAGHEI